MREVLARHRRPCLDGRTSEEVFQTRRGRMFWYNQDRRKAALEHIERMSVKIIEREGLGTKITVAAVWRRAGGTWLLQKGIISIEKGESATLFPSISVLLI